MIDIHIITHPSDRRDWLVQAIQSVPEEATLHFTPYVKGHIGLARLQGYELGEQKYVGYVDPDDYLIPDVYMRMVERAERDNLDGVLCWEQMVFEDRTELFTVPHKGIYRRDFVRKHRRLFEGSKAEQDLRMARVAYSFHKTVMIPEVGYVWRKYNSRASQLRKELRESSNT